MALRNAGRISVRPRGAYDASTSYTRLEMVTYQNGSYIAKQDMDPGILPTNTIYWMQVGVDPLNVINADGTTITLTNGQLTAQVDSALNGTSVLPVQNKVINTALANKVDKDGTKVLSDNNYTTTEKTKLTGIESGAEVNIIETIKLNGTPLTPDSDRAVNIVAAAPSNLDASVITSGVFDIARIPQAALERLVHVANQAARFALTSDDVQLGDTVLQDDTGVMYIVIDMSSLSSGLGYQEYKAARAAAVDWSGVENKPTTFTPSAHTHTMSDITDLSVSGANTYTLNAANWSNKTYTLSVAGLIANQNGILGLSKTATDAQANAAMSAALRISGQAAGSITITADGDVPTVDVPIDLILFSV